MMNSYRTNNTGRGRPPLFAVSAFVIMLILADMATGGVIRSYTRDLAAPVWQFGARIPEMHAIADYLSDRARLLQEIEALQTQVAQLQNTASQYEIVRTENSTLETMVHLAQKDPGITAPVISSFRTSPYGTFVIGAGKRDGIAKGALVLASTDLALGRVSDVGDRSSIVSESFAPDSSLDVRIGQAPTTIDGQGGGNARAILPRGVAVKAGDVVTAPSYGNRAVGVVAKVESNPTSASQQVYIGLPINEDAVPYVYVIPAPQQP